MDPDQQDVPDIGFDFDLSANQADLCPAFDGHDPFWQLDHPADEPWLSAANETNTLHRENAEFELSFGPPLTPSGAMDCTCGQIICCCGIPNLSMPAEDRLPGSANEMSIVAGSLDHHEATWANGPALAELPGDTIEIPQSPQEMQERSKSWRKAQRIARRTKISRDAKHILEQHFSSNPYPDNAELRSLHLATKLKPQTIRTWFSNSRSRKECRFFSLAQYVDIRTDYIQLRNPLRLQKVTDPACHQNA
ncbi:hypothetical protein E8E13_008935 [Curvularia kusanoi]|uniref:Homeobox domain-containing protein n=1 Tax=Curvularia kusanoi TaxID=90978 RepID=A0A9P4TEG0_CURKU|nr:hypothetical protein E8E13_008935 [Curvularia kusanoi]